MFSYFLFNILVVWALATYIGLVRSRNGIKTAWSQIDVQLKRRYELIPTHVETAKGYLPQEREALEAVVKARQTAVNASDSGDVGKQIEAEHMLSSTLRSLFAVTENDPDLKANSNMLSLQEELTFTEKERGVSRQQYNDLVMKFNNLCEQCPTKLVARGKFKLAEVWEVEDPEEREAGTVSV